MKKILFLILTVIAIGAKAQVVNYTPMSSQRSPYLLADSGFRLPQRDTTFAKGKLAGNLLYNSNTKTIWYHNGTKWLPLQTDSLGVVAKVRGKVDSTTIDGNYEYYWIEGVAYGNQLNKLDSIKFHNDSLYSFIGGDSTFVALITGGSGGGVSTFSETGITGFATPTVTNPTTTPAVSWALTNAPANGFWGNNGSSSAAPQYSRVKDENLLFSDVTTNNSNTSNHGFLKKLDNTSTHYMNGQGNWVALPSFLLPADTVGQWVSHVFRRGDSVYYVKGGVEIFSFLDSVGSGGGGGSGTVTSVGLTMPSIFSVSGSPVTTSGTLAVTANATAGDLLYASATNTYSKLGIGSSDQLLRVNSGLPQWFTPTYVSTRDRFGFPAEDVTAAENRLFNIGTYKFDLKSNNAGYFKVRADAGGNDSAILRVDNYLGYPSIYMSNNVTSGGYLNQIATLNTSLLLQSNSATTQTTVSADAGAQYSFLEGTTISTGLKTRLTVSPSLIKLTGSGTGFTTLGLEIDALPVIDDTTNYKILVVNNTTGIVKKSHWIGGGGGSSAWGSITGTLSSQTDLQTALDARVNFSEATTASSSTPAPTGDARENYLDITALAANATVSAPSGTPANHNSLTIRIKDNGTSRTLSWNAIFRAGTDIPLPTATEVSKTIYCHFRYNSADSKWDYTGETKGF